MYKPSTYLEVTSIFLPIRLYMRPIYYRIGYQDETKLLNWVKVHPQLSNNNRHPVDGALVGADSLWPGKMAPGRTHYRLTE
jgi:hypothetical protein